MNVLSKLPRERMREVGGAFMLVVTFFLFFALVSDGYQGNIDQRPLEGMGDIYNLCGRPGALVAGLLYIFLGYASHVLYFITCVWALMLFRHVPFGRMAVRVVGALLLSGAVAGFLHMDFQAGLERWPGGTFGSFVSDLLVPSVGIVGANVVMLTVFAMGMLLATELLFLRAFSGILAAGLLLLRLTWAGLVWSRKAMHRARIEDRESRKQSLLGFRRLKRRTSVSKSDDGAVAVELPAEDEGAFEALAEEIEDDLSRIRVRPSPEQMTFEAPPVAEPAPGMSNVVALSDAQARREQVTERRAAVPEEAAPVRVSMTATGRAKAPMPRRRTAELEELPPDYVYPRHYAKPSIAMLDPAPPCKVGESLTEQLRQTSVLLEKALQTHGIEARVTDVTRGPTITRFELEPAPGIKVSRFLALADDLALALKALGVRVEAPIPGKGRIGIELPNTDREPVVLRDLLESKAARRDRSKLALALGKDIAGEVMLADLTTMPHLLVAGATGSGKTVCIKSLLASLLFTRTPEELQLVLIDPKMVELSIFNDIPHLITPVVTDARKASTSLNWLIAEMEERYRLFAQLRVRNIEVYNESVDNGEIEMPDAEDGTASESVDVIRKLPYIVCVIDELADLMMLARSEVEDAIMRLAQLARAVGIHLVIATQRPSVNVLTGVIKANFPVRIAFQVSSKVDSRCILDEMGAERLIGQGDMLYLPAGRSAPTRIQGAFVSDAEMNRLISYLKTQAPPQYKDEIENFGKSMDSIEDLADQDDDLFDEAVRVVLETGQASISMVQRRLRVGYTRAARLIDLMELKGIVGPHLGSKAREILVDCAPTDRDQ